MPCDVAVVMTGAAEKGFEAAIRSVFAQDCDARIQILIEVATAGSDEHLQALATAVPDRMFLSIFGAYSGTAKGRAGRLQAAMAYAANSRYVAYLDRRSRYAPRHLRDLMAAARSRNGAVSGHADPVDPDDASILLIDKLHAPAAPGLLAIPRGLDKAIAALRSGRGLGETGRMTVFPSASSNPADDPRIDAYFAAHRQYRLLIGGSEEAPPGWLSCANALPAGDIGKRRLPFLDAVFDHIVVLHGLRPISLSEGRHLLGECFRVLRPGGRIFVAERDLALLLRLPAAPDGPADRDHLAAIRSTAPAEAVFDPHAFAVNKLFADGSRPTVYDRELLASLLHNAGFASVRTVSPKTLAEAGIDPFAEPEADPSAPFETVILTALRPAAARAG
ncbi:MAG: class I SAM-dependent methyltransferase [Alphaproteobacteria bacterium]